MIVEKLAAVLVKNLGGPRTACPKGGVDFPRKEKAPFAGKTAPVPFLECERALVVNDDIAACQLRRRIVVVSSANLVVVDESAVHLAPDLDSEFVDSASTVMLAVDGSKHKCVVAAAVDRAAAFVLRAGPSDDQPVVTRAVEVETGGFELELGLARGLIRAVCVFRHEAEVRPAGQSRIR